MEDHAELHDMNTRLLVEEDPETADPLARTKLKRSKFLNAPALIASTVVLGLLSCLLLIFCIRHTISPVELTIPNPRDLRILPLGDSITWGTGDGESHAGYRLHLLHLLEKEGFSVTYTGSQASGTMEKNHHDGWPGATINAIQRLGLRTMDGSINPPPDLIILIAGTNNVLQGQPEPRITTELGELLDEIFTLAPDVRVVLSQLFECLTPACTPPKQDALHAYNGAMAGDVVPRFKSKGLRVVMVGQPGLDMTGTDGIHPTREGYEALAEALLPAVLEVTGGNGDLRDTTL